ncbi:MAG: hypothetical protein J1E41_04970 [Ruminococcus sp.]|nr:hypothetical protein [Ruminococcus sp.]
MKEYSKRILFAIAILWFLIALFGVGVTVYQAITSPDNVNLDGLYSYVGTPMAGGVITYLIKSAIENKHKIKKGLVDEGTDEEISDEDNIEDD